jgi:hypothetical protein
VKGMHVSIYRSADGSDCPLKGMSSRVTQAILIGEGVPELFEPGPDCPALYLDEHAGYLRLLPMPPVEIEDQGRWFMDGGNFAWSHDSRFPCDYPIPIHDREEH